MYDLATKLSREMKFLRVDLYSIGNKILVGELTLYPGSGFIEFSPDSMDLRLGELLQLEETAP